MSAQAQGRITAHAATKGLIEITDQVVDWMAAQPLRDGLLTLFVRHTSCSILIQENIDPRLLEDLLDAYAGLAPEAPGRYRHGKEGPDDMPAHIRASLLPTSLNVPVADKTPLLGRYQGIFLVEHRTEGRPREVALHWLGGDG